ncbi:MAG: hypothetical protein ABJA50_10075 [Chloroflexota bacterium]
MERQKDEQVLPELSAQTVAMMTAEHSSLQAGRFMTVSEASGRSTLFIGTVSGALIAIAFTGQASQMGTAFFMFSLVLFPSLIFMGLFTFERVLQSGIEDLIYARGINLLRHLYIQSAPQMQPYFIMSAHDESGQPLLNVGVHPSWWQIFLTTAGMIAFITSMLAGVFVGLLLAFFTSPLPVCMSAGIVLFLVSFGILQRYQWGQWKRLERNLTLLFPSKLP